MKHLIALLLVATTLAATAVALYAPRVVVPLRSAVLSRIDDDWIPKRSPFTAVEWKGEVPRVRVDGAWFDLLELDGLAAERIVAHCKERHGTRWQKRFSEDLVQVLWELGEDPGSTVSLVLRDDAGVRTTRGAVPMTEANRRSVWEHNVAAEEGLKVLGGVFGERAKVERVDRKHAEQAGVEFRELAEPLALPEWSDAPVIGRERAEQDLDQLEWLVRNRFSYRDLNGVDVAACFDAARLGLRDATTVPELELTLRKLLARFGDGHTRVDAGVAGSLPREYAPFLVEHGVAGPVALLPDRSRPLDAEHPLLVEIDGVPLERWMNAAQSIEARGAAHHSRRRGERGMRYLGWLRAELGLERTTAMTVTLANVDGERVTRELAVASRKPNFGTWPRSSSRMLDDGIAYLRLAAMDDDADFLNELQARLDDFGDARGWIVDVRDNGGGSRDALRAVAARLVDPRTGPLVTNVAAYRLAPGEAPRREGGYLQDRFLFPASWSGWSAAEREAIAKCARDFAPDWTLPSGEFSEWHYMVVSPASDERRFDGPVCVLVDEDCFSATDVFLGALAELPQVSLVGRASGGGSGRSRGFTLANSGIRVRISSMASFRPDGRRYDGRGVEVDVPITPTISDLTGATDGDLEAARRVVLED